MILMRVLFALTALLCLSAAILLWPREYNGFVVSVQDPLTWVLAPTTVSLERPASLEGIYQTLQACDRTMASVGVALAPAEARARISKTCMQLSDSILAQSPTLSLAHMVRAQALFFQGDNAEGLATLLVAEQTGGSLSWMAARRFDLVARRFEQADALTRDMMVRDMKRVMRASGAGIVQVARRYGRSTDNTMRQLIVDAVDQLPEDRQRRFVKAVQQAG